MKIYPTAYATSIAEVPCPDYAQRAPSTEVCVCNKGYQYTNFTHIDLDSSGKLSFSEYRSALRAMDFFSEKELSIRFSGVDRNEDWALSQEEYLNDVGSSFAWHCVPCPMNTFKANLGNQMCTPCPFANTWTRLGADSLDECRCDFGYTGLSDACTACPTGTYKPYPGPYNCLKCGVNTYGSGPAQITERSACLPCPANSTSSEATASIQGCLCGRGFYYQLSQVCLTCACSLAKNATQPNLARRLAPDAREHKYLHTLGKCRRAKHHGAHLCGMRSWEVQVSLGQADL